MLVTILMNIFWGSPYVPSKKKTIECMLKEGNLKKGQTIFDLGCGDGRLLVRAEKQYGIKGIGYEGAPIPYLLAQLNKLFNKSNIEIRYGNLFKAPVHEADAIFLYLGPEVQSKLTHKLQKECTTGTSIISNSFHLPGIEPKRTLPKHKDTGNQIIHIYQL